jgi:hypothetical protein
MAYKKIRKSATMTGIVLSLILLLGIFTGMFLWLNKNVTDSGITMDAKYTEAFGKLNGTTQTGLYDNINDIKNAIENIGEADSTWQVAWNGFKALGETLKLPISFLTTALSAMNITFISLDFVPKWVKTLSEMAITIFIVFILLSILKGDPKL